MMEALSIADAKDREGRWFCASSGVLWGCCFVCWVFKGQKGLLSPESFCPFRTLVSGRPYKA